MKKLQLFIFICLITNLSFAQDIIYYDSVWEVTDKQNHQYYRIQTQEKGKWLVKDYFKNGQLQMEGTYSSLNPDVEDGNFYWFYENGKRQLEGFYIDGIADGIFITFSENGARLKLETYDEGHLNGIYEEYNINGICTLKTEYLCDKRYGMTCVYYDDGTLHSSGKLEDGDRIGEWKYYNESGKLTEIIDYKTDFMFKEAMLYLKLPSSYWHLETKTEEEDYNRYYFKRVPLKNKAGISEVPEMLVYFTDAANYNQNVELFATEKKAPLIQTGINASIIKAWDISCWNSFCQKFIIHKGDFSKDGIDYLIYMVYLITKDNVGVQIYMTMSKELAVDYEDEFKSIVRHLKEM